MPRPVVRVRIYKYENLAAAPREAEDDLAAEEPLEIRIAGRPISITMRTPGHDEELALGFLVGEGVITGAGPVPHIRRCEQAPGDSVDVLLDGATIDLGGLTRHVFVSSSCGICGAASIDAVRKRFAPLGAGPSVPADLLLRLADRLRATQANFERTGGLHAAGLFNSEGELLFSREDVGRHNAVDKVVGAALRARLLPLSAHVLLVSGRASFEIVQKAIAAGITIVAAVSAPSSLAVDLAHEAGLTLAGFLRPGRFNIYSGPQRITPGASATTG
ncbi:MAG: formate dehydrogenase accessory sulfurtransferase FdhD [Phycisphaerales bacterium]|nr:formate dehydrogenase accessory sulfurtransferase FdhD [Phycisphaerales bacterium]